jgi:hypothetical protein
LNSRSIEADIEDERERGRGMNKGLNGEEAGKDVENSMNLPSNLSKRQFDGETYLTAVYKQHKYGSICIPLGKEGILN